MKFLEGKIWKSSIQKFYFKMFEIHKNDCTFFSLFLWCIVKLVFVATLYVFISQHIIILIMDAGIVTCIIVVVIFPGKFRSHYGNEHNYLSSSYNNPPRHGLIILISGVGLCWSILFTAAAWRAEVVIMSKSLFKCLYWAKH